MGVVVVWPICISCFFVFIVFMHEACAEPALFANFPLTNNVNCTMVAFTILSAVARDTLQKKLLVHRPLGKRAVVKCNVWME